MTYKERLQQEHPECVDDDYRGGCANCPESYGYEQFDGCHMCYESNICNCYECWNREIPEPKNNLLKIDTVVEGIPEQQPDKITREMVHEMLDLFMDVCASGNCGHFGVFGNGRQEWEPEVGIQYGNIKEGKYDYDAAVIVLGKEAFPEIIEKLKEIKNAPEATTSKGSVQMDLE